MTFYSLLGVSLKDVEELEEKRVELIPFYSLLGVSMCGELRCSGLHASPAFYSLLGVSELPTDTPFDKYHIVLTFYSLLGVSLFLGR